MKQEQATFTEGYKRYLLGVLMVVYLFNQMDRQILAILQEAIKADLGLSDAQLGLLTGFAFAVFYVTLGIPIARIADRINRVNIIAIAVALWSAMTALSGLAVNYTQLLLLRIGVGIGEAGCTPPAHSIIADYFEQNRRSRALAVYSLGIPLGGALGILVGGMLNEYFGWRVAFFAVGLPGIFLAVLVKLTIKEPPRGLADGHATAPSQSPPALKEVIKTLLSNKTYVQLCIATSLFAFAGNGVGLWVPPFLIRTFDVGTDVLGLALGATSLVAGGAGALLGGFLGDRLAKRDQRWLVWLPAAALAIGVPVTLAALWSHQFWLTVALFMIPTAAMTVYTGPVFGLIQSLMAQRVRAVAVAVFLFIVNMIGIGGGPLAAGLMSDALTARFGAESLKYSLAILSLVSLWAAFHYVLAGRSVTIELERATRMNVAAPTQS